MNGLAHAYVFMLSLFAIEDCWNELLNLHNTEMVPTVTCALVCDYLYVSLVQFLFLKFDLFPGRHSYHQWVDITRWVQILILFIDRTATYVAFLLQVPMPARWFSTGIATWLTFVNHLIWYVIDEQTKKFISVAWVLLCRTIIM